VEDAEDSTALSGLVGFLTAAMMGVRTRRIEVVYEEAVLTFKIPPPLGLELLSPPPGGVKY